jgi:Flp pilus assembly protein TadG
VIARFRSLVRSQRGGAAIEFALLAPVFIALMMGVVEVGIYMQNYSAVRTLATDASRFAAVEYQKNNKVSEATLESNIHSMGIASPYNLIDSRLAVDVSEVSPSPIDGARQFTLTIGYDLPDLVGGTSIDNVTIHYTRQLFVLA